MCLLQSTQGRNIDATAGLGVHLRTDPRCAPAPASGSPSCLVPDSACDRRGYGAGCHSTRPRPGHLPQILSLRERLTMPVTAKTPCLTYGHLTCRANLVAVAICSQGARPQPFKRISVCGQPSNAAARAFCTCAFFVPTTNGGAPATTRGRKATHHPLVWPAICMMPSVPCAVGSAPRHSNRCVFGPTTSRGKLCCAPLDRTTWHPAAPGRP